MSNLLDVHAELGSEDEDYDDQTSQQRASRKHPNEVMEDSSEEEDEDDDEEALAKIQEGFIDDEDEEEYNRQARKREKKRKRRAEREEEEAALDEEDLDLIGEATGLETRPSTQSRFKRLKQGHRDDRASREPRTVSAIFDDEDDLVVDYDDRRIGRGYNDEMEDFIEEDEPEEGPDELDDREVARRPGAYSGIAGIQDSGLDDQTMEDMRLAFGDGQEYQFALDMEGDEDETLLDRELQLKDVFEPAQLEERMLTDEDNEIRATDIPERFQIARKPFRYTERSEEELADQLKEEAVWVSKTLLLKRRMSSYWHEPFQKSVHKVLEFMNLEDFEVPFIFQHRKDYVIHSARDDPDANGTDKPERLLSQNDLWEIFELDLKFKAFAEKRDVLQRTYDNLKSVSNVEDPVFEELLAEADAIEEIQDLQDYIHFQYSAELKDVNAVDAESTGAQKRARGSRNMYERVRASKVYNLVRAFGITADSVGKNALGIGHQRITEDSTDSPDNMADELLDPPEYETGFQVLRKAKEMYAEELVMSPRIRKFVRTLYFSNGLIDCFRTQKGLRQITEDHRFFEFKYLRNQDFAAMARRPELYLRMLKAEDEGLVEVKVKLNGSDGFRKKLYANIESDNLSEAADAWNTLRRETVDMALAKLEKIMTRTVKETLKAECENKIAQSCREKFMDRVDQAPYKPKAMALGTVPRVLALSSGDGNANRDPICWAWVEEDGRMLESGKFKDLRLGNPDRYLPDGKDVASFVELVQRRKPDVIAVSGLSVETRRLHKDLQDIVDKFDLRGAEWEDDDGSPHSDKLEVIIVNDEIARLYRDSERSRTDFPGLSPLTKYCIALAKYLQDPLKEYAALGKDLVSITFDPNQDLIPEEKLRKCLDTVMVDIVNLVGIDINEAFNDPYTASLLPYICGLGPRKANQLLKVIGLNGGIVSTRAELVGDPDKKLLPAVGPKVWTNCASFLFIDYDPTEPDADYLDNTRVHPEDYDLARKIAADALGLDEEDVKAEIDEAGPSAVVRKMIREESQETVNDLVLEQYAERLEQNFKQRKRATLETIRAELQQPYEELRRPYAMLSSDEIFTMLTGYTRETLCEMMIVPVKIKRVFADHIEVILDCGIEGSINPGEFPEGVGGDRGIDPRSVYSVHQTLQAKIVYLNRKSLSAQLTLREDALRKPYRREVERTPGEWDDTQEVADKDASQKEKEQVSGRAQRVIKHPLFRPFNASQAEEYLGSQNRGDVVIRPSSKGLDHLAVTWKVADNVYQHIDVLELDKDNEFSVGKTLKIGGKYTYSDLDELIVNHVKAMAKKVEEIMMDDRYQKGSKAQTDNWLTNYMAANPKRSMYAFCINPKYPGYFYFCFKAGQTAPLGHWPIKIIPNGFELMRNQYRDMTALKNGFKTLYSNSMRTNGQNGASAAHVRR